MISMTLLTPARSDCTANYAVNLCDDYTVGKFINAVLDNYKNEWGCIKCFSDSDALCNIIAVSDAECEYKNGEIIGKKMSDEILNCFVVSATASGGYGLMDYRLQLRTATDISKINLPKGFKFDENGKPVRE